MYVYKQRKHIIRKSKINPFRNRQFEEFVLNFIIVYIK